MITTLTPETIASAGASTPGKISPSGDEPKDPSDIIVLLNAMASGKLTAEQAAHMQKMARKSKKDILGTDLPADTKAPTTLSDTVGSKFRRGVATTERGRLGTYVRDEMKGELTPETIKKLRELEFKMGEDLGYESIISELAGEGAEIVGQMAGSIPTVGEWTLKGAITGAGSGALAPPLAPGLASLGATGGAMYGMYTAANMAEGGNLYLDLRLGDKDNKPLTHEEAQNATIAVGVINGALELAGLKALSAPFKAALRRFTTKEVRKRIAMAGGRDLIKDLAKSYATGVLGEEATEIPQELVSMMAEGFTRDNDLLEAFKEENFDKSVARILEVARKTFMGSTALAVPGLGANTMAHTRNVVREKQQAALNTLRYVTELQGSVANIMEAQAGAEETTAPAAATTAEGVEATQQVQPTTPPVEVAEKVAEEVKKMFTATPQEQTGQEEEVRSQRDRMDDLEQERAEEAEAWIAAEKAEKEAKGIKKVKPGVYEIEGVKLPDVVEVARDRGLPIPVKAPPGLKITRDGHIDALDTTKQTDEDRKKPYRVSWEFYNPITDRLYYRTYHFSTPEEAMAVAEKPLSRSLMGLQNVYIFSRDASGNVVPVATRKAGVMKLELTNEFTKPETKRESRTTSVLSTQVTPFTTLHMGVDTTKFLDLFKRWYGAGKETKSGQEGTQGREATREEGKQEGGAEGGAQGEAQGVQEVNPAATELEGPPIVKAPRLGKPTVHPSQMRKTEGKTEEKATLPVVPEGPNILPSRYGIGNVMVANGKIVWVDRGLPKEFVGQRADYIFAKAYLPTAIWRGFGEKQTSWAKSNWEAIASMGGPVDADQIVPQSSDDNLLWDSDTHTLLADVIADYIERNGQSRDYTDYEVTSRYVQAQGPIQTKSKTTFTDELGKQQRSVQAAESGPAATSTGAFLLEAEKKKLREMEIKLQEIKKEWKATKNAKQKMKLAEKGHKLKRQIIEVGNRFKPATAKVSRVHTLLTEKTEGDSDKFVGEPLSYRVANQEVSGWVRVKGTFDPDTQEFKDRDKDVILDASPDFAEYIGKPLKVFKKAFPTAQYNKKKISGIKEDRRVARAGIWTGTDTGRIVIAINGNLASQEGKAVIARLENGGFEVNAPRGEVEYTTLPVEYGPPRAGKKVKKSIKSGGVWTIKNKMTGDEATIEFVDADTMTPEELVNAITTRRDLEWKAKIAEDLVADPDMHYERMIRQLYQGSSAAFSSDDMADAPDPTEFEDRTPSPEELERVARNEAAAKAKGIDREYSEAENEDRPAGYETDPFTDPDTDPDGGTVLGMGLGPLSEKMEKIWNKHKSAGNTSMSDASHFALETARARLGIGAGESKAAAARRNMHTWFLDQNYALKQVLNKMGEAGAEAERTWTLQAGSSGYAKALNIKFRKETILPLRGSKKMIEAFNQYVLAVNKVREYNLISNSTGPRPASIVVPVEAEAFVNNFDQWALEFGLRPGDTDTIRESANSYDRWMNRVIQDRLDAGLIDPVLAQRLSAIGLGISDPQNYRSLIDPDIGLEPESKLNASGIPLPDVTHWDYLKYSPADFMAQVIHRTYAAISRNNSARALTKAIEATPGTTWGIAPRWAQPPGQTTGYWVDSQGQKTSKPDGWRGIRWWAQGVERELWVAPEIAKAWESNNYGMTGLAAQSLQWLSGSHIVRFLATGSNLGFALTNLFRDAFHQFQTSDLQRADGTWTSTYSTLMPKAVGQYVRNAISVSEDVFTDGPKVQTMLELGAGMEFLSQMKSYASDMYKSGTFVDGALHAMGYFGGRSEMIGRMALMEQSIRTLNEMHNTGFSSDYVWNNWKTNKTAEKIIRQAAYETRNYLDFMQGGSVVKTLDKIFPYFNASIQGTRGIFRSAKRNKVDFWSKTGQLFVASVGFAVLARAFDDENDIDKMSARRRILYWNFILSGMDKEPGDARSSSRIPHLTMPRDQWQRIVGGFAELVVDSIFKYTKWQEMGGKGDPPDYRYDMAAEIMKQLYTLVPDLDSNPSFRAWAALVAGFGTQWMKSFLPMAPMEAYAERMPEGSRYGQPPFFTDVSDFAAKIGGKDERGVPNINLSPLRMYKFFSALMPENNEWIITLGTVYQAAKGSMDQKRFKKYIRDVTTQRFYKTFDPDERIMDPGSETSKINTAENAFRHKLKVDFHNLARDYYAPSDGRRRGDLKAYREGKRLLLGKARDTKNGGSIGAFESLMAEMLKTEVGLPGDEGHLTFYRYLDGMNTAEARGKAAGEVIGSLIARGEHSTARTLRRDMVVKGILTEQATPAYSRAKREYLKKHPPGSLGDADKEKLKKYREKLSGAEVTPEAPPVDAGKKSGAIYIPE